MLSNFNKLVIALFLSVFFVVLQGSYSWAREGCQSATGDKRKLVYVMEKAKSTLSQAWNVLQHFKIA